MEYKFKAGQKVRILEVESLGLRSAWAGRELTLKKHDDAGWDEPGWSTVERDCHYRFRESEMELIQDSPVRTVTRQEIIPGTYDGVKVGERMPNEVWVGLSGCMNADQLERAAAVLTALAGALRDDR
jgi:hypothetical protein